MIAKKHKTQVRNKTELSFKITWCVINVYNVFIHSVFVLPSFFLTVHPCYAAALMMTWGGLMNWSILQSSAWEGSSTATWDRLIRWVFSQPPLSSCFHTSYLHKSPPQCHTVLQIKGVFLSCYSSKPLRAGALDTSGSSFISSHMTMGAGCFRPKGLITGNLLIAKDFYSEGGNFTLCLQESWCMRMSRLWMKTHILTYP